MASKLPAGLMAPLYADLKTVVIATTTKLKRILDDSHRPHFTSPRHLEAAFSGSQVRDGQRLTLNCRLSPFGPFMRRHFLTPLVGPNRNSRLGPMLGGVNPVADFVAQITTHYRPVGLCPPIAEDTVQGFAYDTEYPTAGLVGLVPGVSEMVSHTHVLLRPDHSRYYGRSVFLQGVLRQITPWDFQEAGLTMGDYEACRQQGKIYFVDCTPEQSDWRVVDKTPAMPEFWGALYAHGHLECDDPTIVRIPDIVEVAREAVSRVSPYTDVTQNSKGRQEIGVFGQGVRMVLDTEAPLWCIHMDTELSSGYPLARTAFEEVAETFLTGVEECVTANGARLLNPRDVDFTYLDNTASYNVLRSQAAEELTDPALTLVRDWHKRRNHVQTA